MRAVCGHSALPDTPPTPTASRRSATGRVLEQVIACAPASRATRARDSTTSRSTGVEERRKLHHDGLGRACPETGHQLAKVRLVVTVASPRDVGTARVQLDAVCVRGHQIQRPRTHRRASSSARLTNRGPLRPHGVARQMLSRDLGARVGQTHRVDHGTGPRRARDPRFGVARPRRPGDRATHRVAEPQRAQGTEVGTRLVEARREPDRGASGSAAELSVERGCVDGATHARPRERQGTEQPSNVPATRWAVSGGSEKNSGRPTAAYQPIEPTSWHHARVNDDLVRRMREASELHGDFVLSSGKRSSTYFDKFRFLTRADLLRDVAAEVATMLAPGTACWVPRRAPRCCWWRRSHCRPACRWPSCASRPRRTAPERRSKARCPRAPSPRCSRT